MAVCSNCRAEGSRVRSRWMEDGKVVDECPNCAPGSFEKFMAPSDKKPWMGWEAHPNEYEKRYDQHGPIYERKPEYRAEQEEKLAQETMEEREARQRAEARKRATRRTEPMNAVELATAMRKAEQIAAWLQEAAAQGTDVN